MEKLDVYEIIYNWFCSRPEVEKDDFLCDRQMWDGMQSDLFSGGFNIQHDEIKLLVRKCDKDGYLGGRSKGFSFEDQCRFLDQKEQNRKDFGDPGGEAGIKKRISEWALAMSERLSEYERTEWWVNRSNSYRESVGWICELCHNQHERKSRSLVTHHIKYKFIDGSSVFYNETDEILLAVCDSPCHQLADIARYLRAGRISKEEIDTATQTLLAGIR